MKKLSDFGTWQKKDNVSVEQIQEWFYHGVFKVLLPLRNCNIIIIVQKQYLFIILSLLGNFTDQPIYTEGNVRS